ncbi:MAG TPA: putative inorganic carbon transporter subunit DabA, partial [Marinobacter sp.]|nr:putative inorganic carbon transporter subunit DabA [Marinobacter sp.]
MNPGHVVQDPLQTAVTAACEAIAPIWPLDQFIAVNPWWGMREQSVAATADQLQRRGGISVLMPASFYLSAWDSGRIRQEDVEDVLQAIGSEPEPSLEDLLERLRAGDSVQPRVACSIFHSHAGNASALDGNVQAAVLRQTGRFCARYFDQRQARWAADKEHGLYTAWHQHVNASHLVDKAIGVKGLQRMIAGLPQETEQAMAQLTRDLALSPSALEALCHGLLLDTIGWASWCRGMDWRVENQGGTSQVCRELLTVLLAWEWAGIALADNDTRKVWRRQWTLAAECGLANGANTGGQLWVWQQAFERAWQRQLLSSLNLDESPMATIKPDVQAVFCIDVRSEVIRRNLELADGGIQTKGMAGFFGLALAHQTLSDKPGMRQLPGLLEPAIIAADTTGTSRGDNAQRSKMNQQELVRQAVRSAKYDSLSTFTLVETTGLAWVWKLVRDSLNKGSRSKGEDHEPGQLRMHHAGTGDPLSDANKIRLATDFLRSLSLTDNFAPLLVLVGHGAHTDNNAHHASLACGACGGRNGGLNAQIVADMLNEPAVRAGLEQEGIVIPQQTWVVAGQHCTVTDQVQIIRRSALPGSHQSVMLRFEKALGIAGTSMRRERATPLQLNGLGDEALLCELQRRTRNWAEVRPEWGLANNAAMLIGNRTLSRGCDLGGRVFMHDYDSEMDKDGNVLTAIFGGPVV